MTVPHPPTQVIQRNEVMLQESRNTITVPSTFILRILAYLNRRRRRESISCAACPVHSNPCAVSPVHSMCSVPSSFHVQCSQSIPRAVFPVHSTCSVPSSFYVQCSQFILCAVFPVHSMCSVPSPFHMQCSQFIPCVACSFSTTRKTYMYLMRATSFFSPLVQREQQSEDNDSN